MENNNCKTRRRSESACKLFNYPGTKGQPPIDSDGSQFNFDTAIEDKPMGKSLDAMEVDEQEPDGDDKKELQAAFAAGLLKDGLKK
uniref:Uncharacterized protein n=1 Tax=Caenorhabditis japonica TaxID=281687 RepID=A0A8R1J1X6_CAEJA